MNAAILKFQELMKTDTDFQKKLQEALINCTSADSKENFEKIIVPIAKEYGITATYDDLLDYYSQRTKEDNATLTMDDLSQVAGGSKTSGIGLNLCYQFGLGAGGEGDNCCCVAGVGNAGVCVYEGVDS